MTGSAHDEQAAKLWPTPWRSSVLPEGLPSHGLTTLQLGDTQTEGHWRRGVQDVVTCVLGAQRPVLYVQCGGLGSYFDGEDQLTTLDLPLLRVFEDEDLIVHGPPRLEPPTDSGESRHRQLDHHAYHCHVPSIPQVRAALETHEAAHGTCLLLLSEVQLLRPYWELTAADYGIPTPDGLRLNPAEIDAWRTGDLLHLAETRPGPTVAVWAETTRVSSGLTSLIAASLVHITVTEGARSQDATVLVRRRTTTSEEWSIAPALQVRSRPRRRQRLDRNVAVTRSGTATGASLTADESGWSRPPSDPRST